MIEGNGTIMYQKTGQKDYMQNIYTGVPIDQDNSITTIDVQESETKNISITGLSCDNCWYFINIEIQNPNQTVFQLLITRKENFESNKFREMRLGSTF